MLAFEAAGMDRAHAVAEINSVCRATLYRWLRAVSGQPRDKWPVILESKKLTVDHDTHRVRVWRSMRMMRVFTYNDLQTTAETSMRNLRNYVAPLERTGFVRSMPTGKGRERQFQLLRDSGPHAPRVLRNNQVYDPNLKTAFGEPREVRHG
jgi:hypothetical protein